MANRRSKRFSRYSRSSGGSNVLNPDTDILGDEHPYWWRNLENNTITRPSTDSTNFNQTSRRLNSNSSVRTSNDLDDSWWKVLEGTPRNLKSLEKVKDPSKKDGASEMSESEEEVKVAKKKPRLQSEAKKADGNAFLSALNDSRVLVIPLEKDPAFQKSSFAQGFVSTSRISNDSKQPNKVIDTESSSSGSPDIVLKPKPKILQKRLRNRNANAFEGDKPAAISTRMSLRKSLRTDKRLSIAADSPVIAAAVTPRKAQKSLTESDHDLSSCPPPKATSTLLGSSTLSQQNSVGNSNSDTEPVALKPKSKLLRRHDRDTRKNLFEDILLEDKINEERAADQPNASAVVDESAEEPEPRIEEDETTDELEPRIVEDESKLGDAATSKRPHRTERTDLQDPANDSSDKSYGVLEPAKPRSRFLRNTRRSPKKNLFQRIVDDSDSSITRGASNLSENENSVETIRRLSVISAGSNGCSDDIHLRLSNSSKASDVEIIQIGNSNAEIPSSQSRNPISNQGRGSRESLVSSSVDKKGRNVSFAADHDEEVSDNHSDVTLIIPASNDFDRSRTQRVSSRSKVSSDVAPIQPELSATRRSLKNGSLEIKDSENADDAADAVRDSSRSRKRSTSRSVRQVAVEEAEHSGPAIFVEDRAEHDGEAASRRTGSPNRLRKASASRAGSVSEAEQSARTPSRRRSEKVRTPKRESRDAKRSVPRAVSESETEAAESPLRKQSKRTSRTQEQVSTESESIRAENTAGKRSQGPSKIQREAEDTSPRQSLRLSRAREGRPLAVAGDSEVEGGQTPSKKGRGRTSKVQEQVATIEAEDTAPRPSQRLVETETLPSLFPDSDSEEDNLRISQQGIERAKRQSVPFDAEENEQTEPESTAPRSSRARRKESNEPKLKAEEPRQRRSQRQQSKSRRIANSLLSTEDSETEKDNPPTENKNDRIGTSGRQTITVAVIENEPIEAEDAGQRRSRRRSEPRRITSLLSCSDSETENDNPPTEKENDRTGSSGRQTITVAVIENEPIEAEDAGQRRSRRRSEPRRVTSLISSSDSEEGNAETPTKEQRERTSSSKKQTVEDEPIEAEDAGQRRSKRQSKGQRTTTLLSSSNSKTGNAETPTKEQREGTSSSKKQTVEDEPIEAEDAGQRRSKRRSKAQRTTTLLSSSDSEAENVEFLTESRNERTGSLKNRSVAIDKTKNGPIDAEDAGQRRSKRRSKPQRTTTLLSSSDSEAENIEFPTENLNERSGSLKNRSVAIDRTKNEPIEAEDAGQRRSKRQSKPQRTTTLLSSSDSEAENVEFLTESRNERTGSLKNRSVAIDRTKNELIDAEDARQRRSKRQSKPQRTTTLLSSSDSDVENVEFPTESRNERSGSLKNRSVVIDRTKDEPIEAEDAGQRRSKRQSKPQRTTTLLSSSDSEAENVEFLTENLNERSGSLKNRSVAIDRTKNEPIDAEDAGQRRSKRQSKPQRTTTLLSSSDSEAENIEFPTESGKNRSVAVEKTVNGSIDAEDAGRRQSQRQSSVREEERLHFYTTFDSEDDGLDSPDDEEPARSRSERLSNARRAESLLFAEEAEEDPSASKSQRERGRATQIRAVSISSKEKELTEESSVQKETSLPVSNDSHRNNSVVRAFSEKRSKDRDTSKQHSILDKEDDVGRAVASPSALPTGRAGTENSEKPWSTSLKERGSRSRSKLSRVDLPEEIEEEDEGTEVDRLRKDWSIAEELESTSPNRSTTQEQFRTVPNTEKRSLVLPKRSGSKVEENIEAETRSELEGRSTGLVATEESSATPRKRNKVSIRSITKLHASIGGVDQSPNRSLLRLAVDQNAERVGSPSRERNRAGPSGKSGSLRPLSLNRIEEGSDGVGLTEREDRPKSVHGRTSSLKAGAGKARSSAAPQEIQKGQRKMKDFFETNANAVPASQALSDPQMAQEIRNKVDEIKKREVEEEMKEIRKLAVAAEKMKSRPRPRPKQQNTVPRKVDKAYLVNGIVYKQPRLPRPMKWVTDRLYQHLWKRMEPKFKLDTRVQSEKFICCLSEVARLIAKRKAYQSYKDELNALMKEMARLQIIHNRQDFYNFCHDFLPYELRAKMVPILLPGNQRTIPYDPSKLYEPLLSP